jgi:hypothetical protein
MVRISVVDSGWSRAREDVFLLISYFGGGQQMCETCQIQVAMVGIKLEASV